jgi:hypothetical protein
MDTKKGKLTNLAKKATMVFSASLAALTGIASNTLPTQTVDNSDGKIIEQSKANTVKPMTVLKLNVNNPELSKLIASHQSHSSHSSHRSHYSSHFN